jgi:uncharacterized protein (UPF0264 family)
MIFHASIVGLFLQANVCVQMLDTAAKDGEKSVCKGWEEGVVEAVKTVEEYGSPMSDG